MSHRFAPTLCLALWAFASLALAGTDVYRGPLQSGPLAKPAVVFGMDDSGSMDDEVLLDTNDGAFWWDSTLRNGWNADGTPVFNPPGTWSDTVHILIYLFPDGCSANGGPAGLRNYCDDVSHYAIPPTPQFASLRSPTFNPLYYDTMQTYAPWTSATVNGQLLTFGNANPSAAPSHPLYPTPVSTQTLALNVQQSSTASDFTFLMLPGMTVPAGASLYLNGRWTLQASPLLVGAGQSFKASIPYYPATFWYREACTVQAGGNSNCTLAPDGRTTLRRYEIKSGNTFPSGRTYKAELQNFANWFTYARKRRLMLAGSMGQVLDSVAGMRLGAMRFADRSTPVAMVDTDAAAATQNAKVITGFFAQNPARSGTPTREALNYIGSQFMSNPDIVQSACQRNAAIIVTDGFAQVAPATPPAYDMSSWGSGSPYATTYPQTLADLALAYYTLDLRVDLPKGHVPVSTGNPGSGAPADANTDPHLNTYAVTLGARGRLWPGITDPFAQPITWPMPDVDRDPSAIDDLWHATINGRGQMFLANTPAQTAAAVQAALSAIRNLQGAQGATSFDTVNLGPDDHVAYGSSFRPAGWSGDVQAWRVDTTTGVLGTGAPLWSAEAQLEAAAPGGHWTSAAPPRTLFTWNGSAGVPFTAATVPAAFNLGGRYGATSRLVAYVNGDRTQEGTTLRKRTGLVGAVFNSVPVPDRLTGMVYTPSNDGMVHAFVSSTGHEQWAYLPGFALGDVGAETQPAWAFTSVFDGRSTLARTDAGTLLVGGRGTAGAGWYALNVSSPRDASVTAMAKWEFPVAGSPEAGHMGQSVGQPLVVKTGAGWRVVVTSGYNVPDGRGRLFVIDPTTGRLDGAPIDTGAGRPGDEAGLAQISGFLEPDGSVRYVYGGDLLGNLWRFDLATRTVLAMASLRDAAGRPLPVTAAPELSLVGTRRMVFVGTGRLLGTSDFDDMSTQLFVGLWDTGSAQGDVRALLAPRTVSGSGSTRQVTGAPVDWTTQRGWRLDLPAGEKASTDPSIAYGVLAFTTNMASSSTCSSSSVLYLADLASGLQLPDSSFLSASYGGIVMGSQLSSGASLGRLPDGEVVVVTHMQDGSTQSRTVRVPQPVTPRRTGWKQVQR